MFRGQKNDRFWNTFGALLGGAGGRGGGLPEAEILKSLAKDPTRPAPPEGGAANIYLKASPLPPAPLAVAGFLVAWWFGNILIGSLACWVLLSGFLFR